ncbi:MAG: DUF971 domain-containing protein [Candidatus Hinthialibacter antarcticus]|nr:DUF971 domain-containing protein [Candidatus Hinthialibacter antarcticus]
MEKIQPLSIKRQGDDVLIIEWSDGETRSYSAKELRRKCPCALCMKEEEPRDPMSLPVLSKKETEPICVEQLVPQGHYGYLIYFSDGHNTGTYSLPYLKELGQKV